MNIRKKILEQSQNREVFQYEITNDTDKDTWLDDVLMFRAESLSELGVSEEECMLFRSGRHKNDMPSVCKFGVMDESMMDTFSGMSETGDHVETQGAGKVISSDNLTILGSCDNYVLIGFLTGQNHMFRTDITVDEQGNFVKLDVYAEFRIRLEAGRCILTEELLIEHMSEPNKAIQEFARNKAKRFGSRNTNNLAVFCTWYYYGLTVTYEDVKRNLNLIKEKKLPFDVF